MASSRRTGTNESKWSGGAWASGVNTLKTSGGDYTDISVWESDTDQDLVAVSKSAVLEGYRGTHTASEDFTLSGSTTSASYFRIVRAASGERHLGVPGAGVKISGCITTTESYAAIQDLELGTTINRSGDYGALSHSSSLAEYCTFVGCLLKGTNSGTGGFVGFHVSSNTPVGVVVANCIAYENEYSGFYAKSGVVLYNCTSIGNGTWGFNYDIVEPVYKNCIATGNTSGDWNTSGGGTGTTHNVSGDATAPATGTYYRSKTLYWRDSSIDWYWLAAHANAAIDRGTNLSADSTFAFDDDIAFNTRGAQWDLGAHEWQSESSRRRGINESRTTDGGTTWVDGVATFGGSSRHYTSLATWESDTDVALTTLGRSAVVECYRDAAVYTIGDYITVTGATTSAAYSRIMRAAAGHRHGGVPGAGVHLEMGIGAFTFNEANAHFCDIEVSGHYNYVESLNLLVDYAAVTLVGILATGSNAAAGVRHGIYGQNTTLVNCVFHDFDGHGLNNYGANTYNCTVVGCGSEYGFTYWSADNYYKNCIGYGNVADWYTGNGATGTTHNLSSDNTAPASGTYYRNKSLTFANAAGHDYRLAAGDSDARGKGTNLSRDGVFAFNDDITGRLRTQWDLGAAEYCISSRRRGVNEQVSTFGDTGFGRDYTSLSTWESDTDVDLMENAESEVVECYADAASYSISEVTLAGATASSSYRRFIRPVSTERHCGVPSGGIVFACSGTSQGSAVLLEELGATVQDLELQRTVNYGADVVGIGRGASESQEVVGVMVSGSNSGAGETWGIYAADADTDVKIVNCIVYDCERGMRVRVGGSVFANTVYGSAVGFNYFNDFGTLKNCLGYGCSTSDFETGSTTPTSTHNLSEDATAPAFGTYYRNKTLAFENAGSDIYRLANTDWDAISKGTDLSADAVFPFEDDIAWKRRNATWEVGAAMKETVTRTVYVDTDVVGGSGNGTSWANAYASLSAAEAAEDDTGDLREREECIVFLCRGATADTTPVEIYGWTTTAWNHITVQTPTDNRHAGKWSTTKYRLEGSNLSSNAVLKVHADYVRLDGLQVRIVSIAGNYVSGIGVDPDGYMTAVNNQVEISNCLVVGNNDGTYINSGIGISNGDANVKAWNCIVWNIYPRSENSQAFGCAGAVMDLSNCIGIGGATAFYARLGRTTLRNCYGGGAYSTNYLLYQATALDKVNCASEDQSADDTGTGVTATNCLAAAVPLTTATFADPTNADPLLRDFRPVNNSALVDAGVNLAHLFTTDAAGVTRGAVWDIGAFEWISTSPSVAKFFFRRLRW